MYRLLILSIVIVFISCSETTEITINDPQTDIPIVTANSAFSISLEEDITYGQGKSHSSWNSSNSVTMDLKLDVYVPNNNATQRPAILLIHGGGFISGSKKAGAMVNLAQFYASRGWVAFSINYRLRDDHGTVPSEWFDYITNNFPSTDHGQGLAIYPAHRDAKAALRWMIANAETYNIDTNYITVGGGSAGAVTAVTLGITDTTDYLDELSATEDETLNSTNGSETYEVHTIVDFWGSGVGVDAINLVYGNNRYDSQDAPLIIFHGTNDPTVLFTEAQDLRNRYITTGVPFEFYPLQGLGHGVWNATIDGRRMEEVAFDFIVEQQGLSVFE